MKIIFVFVMISSIFMLSGFSAEVTNGFTKGMLEERNNVYKISDTKVLIKSNNQLKLVDLVQGEIIKDLKIKQIILDVHSVFKPNKIIVLTQTGLNKIQKHVFNENGVEISSFEYALTVPKDVKVKWVAPNNAVNERLIVQQGNLFTLYQESSKIPLVKFDAKLMDPNYEYVNVDDWEYENYPYLVIKYSGQRIMAEDYFVRIINLYTKKISTINNFDTDYDFMIKDQNKLLISTYWDYSQVYPANAPHPISTDKQTFFSLYKLNSGEKVVDYSSLFNEVLNQTSGWDTQVVEDYVFVQDLGNNLWSLYQSNGTEIALKQTGLNSGSKFLGYNAANHMGYFLGIEEGFVLPKIISLQIK
ncbi:hypothetical protein [Paenibacillus sp. P46E]|uniref:hypothetical protein n=1 Tax=Paenibacillus sp. P46E TaxID=1349436 RepID=UPI001160E5D1|nr:hypothetical protein [Paenibacillus sp. P46E]